MGVLGPIVPDEGANGTKDTNGRASGPATASAFGPGGGAKAVLARRQALDGAGALASVPFPVLPSVPSVPSVPPAFLEDGDGWAGIDPEWDDADLWDIDNLLG